VLTDWITQSPYGVRFDWGLVGAGALSSSGSCLVIVDVLSFTTAVTVAVQAGMRVFPYAWRDETAAAFARRKGAELAGGRRTATGDAPWSQSPWSLSPAALSRAPFTARLVLPSPNGSAICAAVAASEVTIVAACLRNGKAVGRWLAAHGFGTPSRPVTVIAAGERWPDGNLRPALEDLLGAGAVIAALRECGAGLLPSPEAQAARVCYQGTADVPMAVTNCASGRELADGGFAADVAFAIEMNSCSVVPVIVDQAFTAAS